MALNFSASNNLSRAGSLVSAADPRPITLSIWARPTSRGVRNALFCNTYDIDHQHLYFEIYYSGANDLIRLYSEPNFAGNSSLFTLTAGAWTHLAASWAVGGAVAYYRDGQAIGTSTLAYDGAGAYTNVACIGSLSDREKANFYFTGGLAEFGAWNAILTPGEIHALANGEVAENIRKRSLVSSIPLLKANAAGQPDLAKQRLYLTVNGSLTDASNHPPVWRGRYHPRRITLPVTLFAGPVETAGTLETTLADDSASGTAEATAPPSSTATLEATLADDSASGSATAAAPGNSDATLEATLGGDSASCSATATAPASSTATLAVTAAGISASCSAGVVTPTLPMARAKPASPRLDRRHSLARGLVAAWPYVGCKTVADPTGGKALTLTGTTTQTGPRGPLPYFSGTAHGDGGTLDFTRSQPFSVALTAAFDASTARQTLVGNRVDNIMSTGWEVGYSTTLPGSLKGLYFNLTSDANTSDYLEQGAPFTPVAGRYYRLTFTYDGSGTAAGVKLYVDGLPLVKATANRDTLSTTVRHSTQVVQVAQTAGGSNRYAGSLGDIFVWTRALSPAEVVADAQDPTAPMRPRSRRPYLAEVASAAGTLGATLAGDSADCSATAEAPPASTGTLSATLADDTASATSTYTAASPPPVRAKPSAPRLSRRHSLAHGLVAYWPFEASAAAGDRDAVSGRVETPHGITGAVAPDGACLDFNGSSAYAGLNVGAGIGSLLGQGSYTAFVRAMARTTSRRQVILGDWNASGSAKSLTIEVGGYLQTTGHFTSDQDGSGYIDSGVTCEAGRWYDLVITWDAATGDRRFYVDGRPAGNGGTASSLGVGTPTASLGRAGAVADLYFDGSISALAFWSCTLSPAEVARLAVDPYSPVRPRSHRAFLAAPPASAGTLEATLADATAAGSATATDAGAAVGTLSATLAGDTASGSGTAAAPPASAGTLAATLAGDSAAAVAVVPPYGPFRAKPSSPRLDRRHPLARGLISAWPYSGGNKVAGLVSGNTLTLTGTAPLSGPRGVLPNFAGSARGDGAKTFELARTQPFTIAASVSFDATGTRQVLIGNQGPTAQFVGWEVGFSAALPGSKKGLYLDLANNKNTANYLEQGAILTPAAGRVYRLAWTYDGSGSAAGVQIYADGLPLTKTTATADGLTGSTTSGWAVQLGQNRGNANQFAGRLGDILIWNRALSPAEIAADSLDPSALVRPRQRRPFLAAPSSCTATLGATLGSDTASGSATAEAPPASTATLSATLADLTAAGTGNAAEPGVAAATLAATLAGDTASCSATATAPGASAGTLSATTAGITASGSATAAAPPASEATGSATFVGVTAAFDATANLPNTTVGTLAATLASDSASGTADVLPIAVGSLALMLAGDTVSGSAEATVPPAAAATFTLTTDDVTAAGTATADAPGTSVALLAQTLAGITASSTAEAQYNANAVLTRTLQGIVPSLSAVAQKAPSSTGTLGATLSLPSASFSVDVTPPPASTSTLSVALAGATASFAATSTAPGNAAGTLARTLTGVTASCSATATTPTASVATFAVQLENATASGSAEATVPPASSATLAASFALAPISISVTAAPPVPSAGSIQPRLVGVVARLSATVTPPAETKGKLRLERAWKQMKRLLGTHTVSLERIPADVAQDSRGGPETIWEPVPGFGTVEVLIVTPDAQIHDQAGLRQGMRRGKLFTRTAIPAVGPDHRFVFADPRTGTRYLYCTPERDLAQTGELYTVGFEEYP